MIASQFMDKQITGLSGAVAHGGDLMELANPGDGHQSNGASTGFREEILPSYDFQPIRRAASPPPPPPHVGIGGGGAWESTDSKPSSSNFRNYGSFEAHESSKVIHERNNTYDMANMVEIDHIVKKYADILLHTLDGVNSRLSQLEGRTYNLETAVDDLKLSIENSGGSTDGKLRQLENILREVQTGMHVIRDKQAIAEAQMQLSKLQVSKGDNQPSDNSTTIPSDSQQPPMPLPQQPLQQPAQPSTALSPLQIPALPAPPVPNAPVPAPPQPNPTPIQFSTQIPQPHVSTISSMPPREPYLPPPSQASAEAPPQHYQPPPQQTHLPPPQPYPPAPQLTQYSQPPQPPPQPLAPSQFQHSLPHHTEESSPYMPSSQAYPPSIHQPPHLQSGPPPQQIYGPPSVVYEPPASRPAPVQPHFPTGYGPPSGSSFSDSYGGSPSPYRSAREHSPFPSSSAPSGGSTYPRLPTAQILPPAQPTGSSSGGSTGNRVPLDDVIDKVTTMGFPRDLVRATVRKLTENGQSVDLNVVLDKLMNGSGGQPPKGWYGR